MAVGGLDIEFFRCLPEPEPPDGIRGLCALTAHTLFFTIRLVVTATPVFNTTATTKPPITTMPNRHFPKSPFSVPGPYRILHYKTISQQ